MSQSQIVHLREEIMLVCIIHVCKENTLYLLDHPVSEVKLGMLYFEIISSN